MWPEREVEDRVLAKSLGENGPLCSQRAVAEERALDGKEGRIRLTTRKHC